jgi:hypothetical protein
MSRLTPSVRFKTTAPFPIYVRNKDTGEMALQDSPKRKIIIDSCSELMDYSFPGSKYSTSSNFTLLHDLAGQPMVLSVGSDKV